MSAPDPLAHATMATNEVRERRRRRAAIAARLMAGSADGISTVGWDLLDVAPDWLAWPDARLATLQRQIGALLYAPEIRLWIDGARLGAARAALGETYMHALAAQRDLRSFPSDAPARPRIESAAQVADQLRTAGAAVLLASLPEGALRDAVAASMAPATAAVMASGLAHSLINRALALGAPARSSQSTAGRQP